MLVSIWKTIKLQYDHFTDILSIIASESHGMENSPPACMHQNTAVDFVFFHSRFMSLCGCLLFIVDNSFSMSPNLLNEIIG